MIKEAAAESQWFRLSCRIGLHWPIAKPSHKATDRRMMFVDSQAAGHICQKALFRPLAGTGLTGESSLGG
jgi:hypothetical protein